MSSSRSPRPTHAAVYITANYGTGTPEEAAAWVNVREQDVKRSNVRYWEIGNENYGTWEADNNTRPHDPVTYATRFKEYWRQMKAVDPIDQDRRRGGDGEDAYRQLHRPPGHEPAHRRGSQGLDAGRAGHAAAARRHTRLRGLSPL